MLSALLFAVAVVAHDPGYHTSLARHVARWLSNEGVSASVSTPAALSKTLAKERIAFLVGFSAPNAREMAALKAFRQRGGKLVVFHSGDPALAALVGVQPLGYAAAPYPGAWSRMQFTAGAPVGCPGSILQNSAALNRVAPVAGRGRVVARWLNRAGKPSGEAAWIATDAGWWMSHVLMADGDEALKARLLASMCGAVDPSLWNAERSRARERARPAGIRQFAARQVPRPGEIHAVWEHSGSGLFPGNWAKTFAVLKAARVTDLFVNVAGAGFAHYPSAVLPRSKTCLQEGDQLAKALVAAKGSGVRVHAWVLCFTATRASPETLKDFARRGWRVKNQGGGLSEYLDPANPAVRARILAAVDELQAQYPSLAGIHLDFVRYDSRCVRPKNAARIVSGFVAEARRHVRRPKWLTTAVLGKYPACVSSVGQDWVAWVDGGLVDYVVPMDYADSTETFRSYAKQHASTAARARRTIAGIGVTANESRLDARKVIEQILVSRQCGLAGNALFDLDVTLEREILPYLRLGTW